VERFELLPGAQVPAPFHAPERSTPFFPTDFPTWAPEPGPPTIAERTLTYEELDALEAAFLKRPGYAMLERVMEEGPSAELEFLVNIEHSGGWTGGAERSDWRHVDGWP
jgi:hypothetical protein